MSLYLVVSALAGLWVYNDTKERGYDLTTVLLWTGGTLIAPYIFLPLYLLLGRRQSPFPPGQKKQEEQETVIDVEAVPVEETVKCPMCAGQVKEDFLLCPYCGFTLKPKCQACGREVKREWKTCPYCDQPVSPK